MTHHFDLFFNNKLQTFFLVTNDKLENHMSSLKDCTKNVYAHILNFFKKLKHLSVFESYSAPYPCLSLCHLSSDTFHSSILTEIYTSM